MTHDPDASSVGARLARTGGLLLGGALGVGLAAELTRPGPPRPPPAGPDGAAASTRLADAPEAAAGLAAAAVRADPADDRAHETLHAAYRQLGRAEELPDVYASLLTARPQVGRYAREYGRALLRAGRPSRAALALEAVLASYSFDREVRRLLGLALIESGEPGRAAEQLGLLDDLDRGTARYYGLALALSGRPAEGVAILREVQGGDQPAEAALFLGTALRLAGELDEAEAVFRGLLVDRRAPPAARAELARLYLEPARRDPGRALEHAEAAVRRGEPCYGALARGYAALGEVAMARATAEVALADDAAPPAVRGRCREVLTALGGPGSEAP